MELTTSEWSANHSQMLILPTLIPPVLHQDNLYSLTFFLLKLHQQIKVHALRCLHLVRSLQDYNNTIQYNTINTMIYRIPRRVCPSSRGAASPPPATAAPARAMTTWTETPAPTTTPPSTFPWVTIFFGVPNIFLEVPNIFSVKYFLEDQ